MPASDRTGLAHEGPAVIIARGPCVRLPEMRLEERGAYPYFVDEALCTQCDACFRSDRAGPRRAGRDHRPWTVRAPARDAFGRARRLPLLRGRGPLHPVRCLLQIGPGWPTKGRP